MAGQSINDRLTAARYSLVGQGLAKSVCKATTEEVIGPKKKHLDYLLQCTNEPNVSIPQLANLLIERSQMQSWVIVFKALITVHHLMCYGNEARDALDCYKKFLIRMDRVSEFLKVAEAVGMEKSEIPDLKQMVGIDKGDIPDLAKAPSSLLDALEAHLLSLEGKKPSVSTANASVSIKNVVSVLTSTSTSFGLASSNGRIADESNNGEPLDEITRRAALAEEEALYEKIKQEHSQNNPFLSSPTSEAAPQPTSSSHETKNGGDSSQIIDLFGADKGADNSHSQAQNKTSDDLLQLGVNPFADVMSAPGTQHAPYTNGFILQSPSSTFVSDNAFEEVFGNSVSEQTKASEPNPFALFGDTGVATVAVQPTTTEVVETVETNVTSAAFDGFGDILKPEGNVGSIAQSGAPPVDSAAVSQPQKLISGDLDLCLSSLVDNLNIKGPAQKGQWSSPKTQGKTGGAGWTPAAPATVTGAYRPQVVMGNAAGVPSGQVAGQWGIGAAPVRPGYPQQMGVACTAVPVTGGQNVVSGVGMQAQPQGTFDPFGAL